jgi:hypothetical protein
MIAPAIPHAIDSKAAETHTVCAVSNARAMFGLMYRVSKWSISA